MKLRYKLLALCLSALSVFAVGCGEVGQFFDELKCSHDYGETPTHVLRAATCKQEGLEVWTCLKCKKESERATSKLAHTELIDEAVAATSISAGKTEGKVCAVCDSVIVQAKEISPLAMRMETPKVTFRRTDNGLDVYVRGCMPVADLNEIDSELTCYGVIFTKYENIAKCGALTEENVFGKSAVYQILDDTNSLLDDGVYTVHEWTSEEDTSGGSSPWVAASWFLKADISVELLTKDMCFVGYLKVGEKRFFADSPGAGAKISIYNEIKKAYAAGNGCNADYVYDKTQNIVFTESEKAWLYENYIKRVESST